MEKKYIIEIPDDKISDFLVENNTHLFIPYSIVGYKRKCDTGLSITPYTEPDLEQVKKEAYDEGYISGSKEDFDEAYLTGYNQGLADAWEAARKIADMPYGEEEKAFGSGGWTFIEKHTAHEAIDMLKAYEQEQEEFKVGDEFENENDKKFVVLKMNGKEIDRYIDGDGKTYVMDTKYSVIRKTGRHFPEIAAVLEKMRGESND